MLNRLTKFFLYLSLLTPLVFSASLIFPFITPRVVFFQTCVTLALIFLLFSKNLNLKEFLKNKITILVFLFFVSLIISSVLGVDVRHSFIGNYERSLGVVNSVYFYAFFAITAICFCNRSYKPFISFALAISVIVSILGIFQYVGWPYGNNFFLTQSFGKVWSTLGNYIYLSSYSLFGIFFSLHYLFQNKNWRWKIFYFVSFLFSLLSLLMGASRGPFLGFLVGLGFLILVYFFKGSRRVKINMISLLIIIMAFLGVSAVFRTNRIVKIVPGLHRLADFNILEGTGSQRLLAWRIGLEAFRERPLFGWGNENVWIAFNKYYDPRVYELGGIYEVNKDRFHNRYLDILVEQGLVGLLIWLILIGFIVHRLWIKRAYILLSLWLAYSVNLFFVFSSQSDLIMLFLFLGLATSYENNS